MISMIASQIQKWLSMIQSWLEQWLTLYQEQVALWLLVLISIIIGGILYCGCLSIWRKWRIAWRFKKGLIAEKSAAKYLRHRGYKILATQLQRTITVYVDGEPQKSTVRADFLVRKGWKKYIVEVKTGKQGTVQQASTRRQLLEYKLVYEPDGIILLDMEHHNLQKIRFAYGARLRGEWLRYGMLGVLTGVLTYGALQIF